MTGFDIHLAAKAISIGLAGAALICGLRAIRFARQASQVRPDPGYTCEPGDAQLSTMYWTTATMEAGIKSGWLNGKAVPWMNLSLWLGMASATVATVFG